MSIINKIGAVVLILVGLWAIVGGGGCVMFTAQGMYSTSEGVIWGLFGLIGVFVFWMGALMVRKGVSWLRGTKADGSHDS